MENSLKAFLIAASVIITCVVLAIGFYISKEGSKTALLSAGKITQLNMELSQGDASKYDGLIVSGSDVLSVSLAIMVGDKSFCNKILIYTKKNSAGIVCNYNYKTTNETAHTTLVSNIRNSSNISYINPKGKFLGSITKDANGVITELIFRQQ